MHALERDTIKFGRQRRVRRCTGVSGLKAVVFNYLSLLFPVRRPLYRRKFGLRCPGG